MCRPFYSFILSPFLFPCRTSSGRPHRKTQKQDCYLSSLCLPSLFTFVGPLFSLVFSQEQAKKASRQFLCARLFERSYRGRQRKARATRPARHSSRGCFCRYRLKVLLFFFLVLLFPDAPPALPQLSRPLPVPPEGLLAVTMTAFTVSLSRKLMSVSLRAVFSGPLIILERGYKAHLSLFLFCFALFYFCVR